MGVPPELFDDDYLHFYAEALSDEHSDADAATIARLLPLKPGMRVLDIPCGEGRIARRLALLGCDVVGIDNSDRLLGLAKERGGAVTYAHQDMRNLDTHAEYDAIVNWFTSFGYFDTATNDKLLARFAQALKPAGRLLLEMHNPYRLQRILELTGGATAVLIEKDSDLMVDRVTYQPTARRSHTERFIIRGGHVRKLEFTLEQVTPSELTQRLRRAGFRDIQLYGRRGERFEPEDPRLIALATR